MLEAVESLDTQSQADTTVRPDVENLKHSLHDAGIAAAWAGILDDAS